jgi:23S rRNA (guanosine2251-2'-O)-methyltransferase
MIMYGLHACLSALRNPRRNIHRILISDDALLEHIPERLSSLVKKLSKRELESHVSPGSIHQSIVLDVQPLSPYPITFLDTKDPGYVVVLDHVSDPHNVGAIFRSSLALGARAIVMTERHMPKESGVLTRSASGAFDQLPRIVVTNLVKGLEEMKAMGYWIAGLAEEGEKTLDQWDLRGKSALVVGSEGDGMRQLVQKSCDFVARLPTLESFSSLNVSNAVAIGLYEIHRQNQRSQE